VIEAVSCPGPAFNVPGTSGFYAQMTGLLAGFAFAAMVVLLTPTQNVEREIVEGASGDKSENDLADKSRSAIRANDNGLFLALLAAFFVLIISTLTYSVLAGETLPQARGRAATEELVDGLPFTLAVIMLFHGVSLLLDNGNVSKTAVWLSRIVAVGVAPVLAILYLTTGATDMESARLAQQASKAICSGASAPPALGIALTLILVAVLTVSMTVGRRIAGVRARIQKMQSAPPVMVVTIGVVAAALSSDISTRSDDFLMSPGFLNLYLIGTTAVLAFIGVTLSIGGGRESLAEGRGSSNDAATKHESIIAAIEESSREPGPELAIEPLPQRQTDQDLPG
jgi:hypothetical protein